jgi:hypothetical protein
MRRDKGGSMGNLVSVLASIKPVYLLYVLAGSFVWYAGKNLAQGNTKFWSVAGKGIGTIFHELTTYPANFFPETPERYRKLIRHNRIQWVSMKGASYVATVAFFLFLILAAERIVLGNPAPGFPVAATVGICLPALLARICDVECARLQIQRRELEKKLAATVAQKGGE